MERDSRKLAMVTTLRDYQREFDALAKKFFFNPVRPTLREYGSCKSDADRFSYVENFVDGEVSFKLDLPANGKDAQRSATARNEGNKTFSTDNFQAALKFYNESVVYAPWPGKSANADSDSLLALAFGNRSAVFFRLGLAAECIADVDRALRFGSPSSIVKKLLTRKVGALIAGQRYEDALTCLKTEFPKFGVCAEKCPDDQTTAIDEDLRLLGSRVRHLLEQQKTSGKEPSALEPRYPTVVEMRDVVSKMPLKDGPHAVFPAASRAVDFKYNKRLGRHFIAGTDISAGEILLIEPYFVSGVVHKYALINCVACCLKTDAPYPCSNCSSVVFCSETCASGPAAELHARECSFLPLVQDSDYGHISIQVLRTLLTKTPVEWRKFSKRAPGNLRGEAELVETIPKPQFLSNEFESVFCLQKRHGKSKVGEEFRNAMSAVYLIKLLDKFHFRANDPEPRLRKYLGGIALRQYLVYGLNSDGVWEYKVSRDFPERDLIADESNPLAVSVGVAVHPTFELFNSECAGNLMAAHFGDTLVVRARRTIRKGEMLSRTLLLGYVDKPRDVRRKDLEERYGFKCRCRACVGDWPDLFSLVEHQGAGTYPVRCPSCAYRFKTMKDCLEMMRPTKKCPNCKRDVIAQIITLMDEPKTRKLDELIELTRTACTILEEPHHVLAGLEILTANAFMSQGNRRYYEDDEEGSFSVV